MSYLILQTPSPFFTPTNSPSIAEAKFLVRRPPKFNSPDQFHLSSLCTVDGNESNMTKGTGRNTNYDIHKVGKLVK